MNYEYLKIDAPEKIFGTKNLLQSQVYLINILKQFKKYQTLRKQELTLKVALKSKIGEIDESMVFLEKLLPKAKVHEEEKIEIPNIFPEHKEKTEKEHAKELSLEQELDTIQRRLTQLQGQ